MPPMPPPGIAGTADCFFGTFWAAQIEQHLRLTGLSPLPERDFPPRYVLLHFTNLRQDEFDSDVDYLRSLAEFYRGKGICFNTPPGTHGYDGEQVACRLKRLRISALEMTRYRGISLI
jgi:hypothetical protein